MWEGNPVRRCCRPRLAWLVLALLTLAASSGCTIFQGVNDYLAYNDSMNDFVLGYRNGVWARQAWHERKGRYLGEPQFHSFGEGFRDGYASVASGGNGCPPALPPRKFWSWKYQSPEGQAKVAAWFAGYPHGATAAEEDGAGLYQQIQVSNAIERQYSPEFPYSNGVQNPSTGHLTPAGESVPVPSPFPGSINPGVPPQQSPSVEGALTTPDSDQAGTASSPSGVAFVSHTQPTPTRGSRQIPSFVPIRLATPKPK